MVNRRGALCVLRSVFCVICLAHGYSGGTPNLSGFTRAIPVALYSLPPENPTRTRSLPHESWEKMTPMGKHICRFLVCNPGEEVMPNEWEPDWHNLRPQPPTNANAVHVGAKVDNPFAASVAKM